MTFLILVFGVIWGVIFYRATLNGGAIVGGVTVLVGVALVLEVLLFKRQQAKT